MNTRELLSHLLKLEDQLNHFSYTELKTAEASALKQSFESFKNGLEEKVFGVPVAVKTPNNVKTKAAQEAIESSLVANVSHELRTPLNGILGFVDLLKETKLSAKQQELTNALQSASNNLMDIVNELLEYSKLSAGHEKFERVTFNFYNLIDEVTFLCQTLIVDKKANFKVHLDENIPKILVGDPSKLSQILLNLLGNAIKFVNEGEIQLKIDLKSDETNRVFLGFEISDTGIGIADDKLKLIFDSYKQAEPDTHLKYGGSGLGLSIVKQIVDRLNGCIGVSSTLGKGTTFKLIIPYEKGKKATEKKNIKNTPSEKDLNIKGSNILVLEDNTLNQKLLETRLHNWGCTSYIVDNGLQGLRLLENEDIDVVLLDLRMPGLDGFQVAERIRNHKNARTRQLPIIALSADLSVTDKENCKKYGIDDFILKPYKAEDLLKKIAQNKKTMMTENVVGTRTVDAKALVDLNPIYEECMGQTELLEELVRLFKLNVLEFIGNTKMHLQSNNFQGVGFASHKIKSSLKMMRAEVLSEICEQISMVCKTDNDSKHLQFLYNQFLDEYPRVENELNNKVEQLKKGK